jgi:hypothetical protein
MKVQLAVTLVLLVALTGSANAKGRQTSASPSAGSWTVVRAEDCDNGIGPVRELTVRADGKFVAASRHEACLWRASDGRKIKQLEWAQPLAFIGNLLFAGETAIDPEKLAPVGSDKLPGYQSEHADTFAIVDRTSVALLDVHGRARIYDWSTKVARDLPGRWASLSNAYVARCGEWDEDGPTTLAWASIDSPARQGSFRLSRNSAAVVIGMGGSRAVVRYGVQYTDSQAIEIWDVPTGRRIAILPAKTYADLGISPDGKALVTYDIPGPKAKDGEIDLSIWDVQPLRKTAQLRVQLAAAPSHFRFDEAAKTLVVCDAEGACAIMHR